MIQDAKAAKTRGKGLEKERGVFAGVGVSGSEGRRALGGFTLSRASSSQGVELSEASSCQGRPYSI